MNNIENVIKAIETADRIERECAERVSSILRTACDELQELQDRIDAGEFRV
jgi:hypothetical protein